MELQKNKFYLFRPRNLIIFTIEKNHESWLTQQEGNVQPEHLIPAWIPHMRELPTFEASEKWKIHYSDNGEKYLGCVKAVRKDYEDYRDQSHILKKGELYELRDGRIALLTSFSGGSRFGVACGVLEGQYGIRKLPENIIREFRGRMRHIKTSRTQPYRPGGLDQALMEVLKAARAEQEKFLLEHAIRSL